MVRIRDEWLEKFNHVFLVREPEAAFQSLWRVSTAGPTTYYDPNEIDYARMHDAYNRITNVCGNNSTIVLEADDDLLVDTKNALKRLCDFIEIDFDPSMAEWEAEDVETWKTWKGWHEDVAKSCGFDAPLRDKQSPPESIVADISERVLAATPIYQGFSLQAARERAKYSNVAVEPLIQMPEAPAQFLLPADKEFTLQQLIAHAAASKDSFELININCLQLKKLDSNEIAEARRLLDRPLLLPPAEKHTQKAVAEVLSLSGYSLPSGSFSSIDEHAEFLKQQAIEVISNAREKTIKRVLKYNAKTRVVAEAPNFAGAMSSLARAKPELCVLTDGELSYSAKQFADAITRMGNVLQTLVDGTIKADERWVLIFATRNAKTALAMGTCLACGLPFLEVPIWYRDNHIEEIVTRINPVLALCDSDAARRLEGLVPTLCFDELFLMSDLATASTHRHYQIETTPKELAHGVLTSGTTSVSKVVRIPQSQVFDSLNVFANYVSPGDRLGLNMWLTCYVFYAPLLGATSVVVPDNVMMNPRAFIEFVRTERLTQLMVTPSLLEGLIGLDTDLTEGFSTLHTLWISGEGMPSSLWETAASLLPEVRFLNLYGINETGDVGIAHDASGRFEMLPGIEVYILDSNKNMIPDGAIGDMYIASHGLSDGYIGDSEASRKNFVSNPFRDNGPDEPKILYRAGDRVRRDGCGHILFAGRDTAHLKLRGFKIDPGRIESVLMGHSDVEAAVVKTRGDSSKKQILAYVVLNSGKEPTGRKLREYCAKRLPSYAVPNVFYSIDKVPLAGSKKRDESILGDEIKGRLLPEDCVNFTQTQKLIIEAFHAVLGDDLPALKIDDSFFDFAAAYNFLELQEKLNSKTGIELSLQDVYEDPTVSGLAEQIEAHKSGQKVAPQDKTFDVESEAANLPLTTTRTEGIFRRQSKSILLTGATGFAGKFILAELLKDPKVLEVFCIVRAENINVATKRIWENAPCHFLTDQPIWEKYKGKITVLSGDITKPDLGLSETVYLELTKKIDTVIHCAAEVNWVKPYQNLKSPNVLGTAHVFGFSAKAGAPVTLLSTVPANQELSGYHYSKLVCEAYGQRCAMEAGLPVRVVRCGDIAAPVDPDLKVEVNQDDYIVLLLQAALELGIWPADVNWVVNLAPVDSVARLITAEALQDGSGFRASVLVNSENLAWKTMCQWIAAEISPNAFRETTLASFIEALEQRGASRLLQRAKLIIHGSLDDLESGPDHAGLSLTNVNGIPQIDRSYIRHLISGIRTSEGMSA